MVPFQLPTGKTILIEDPFSLSDEDIQNLIADDLGVEINNPFSNMHDAIKIFESPDLEE
jgi:hypothetical protein